MEVLELISFSPTDTSLTGRGDGANGKGCTATRVAVDLGEDDAVEATRSEKCGANETASWPVIASSTSKKETFVGLVSEATRSSSARARRRHGADRRVQDHDVETLLARGFEAESRRGDRILAIGA